MKFLLSFQADINKMTKLGYTPLFVAVHHSRLEVVQTSVEHGADVNREKTWGSTPLLWAVERKMLELVKLLLQSGADSEHKVEWRLDIDAVDYRNGGTALYQAVKNEDEEMAHLLLSHGAKILTGRYWSPLHLAAQNGNDAIARLLLEHGADIDEPTPTRDVVNPFSNVTTSITGGETPLWLAAARGHLGIVQLLLQGNAAIDTRASPRSCKDHNDQQCLFATHRVLACTAVHIAVAHGYQEVAHSLVDAGGIPNAWIDCWRLVDDERGKEPYNERDDEQDVRQTRILHLAVRVSLATAAQAVQLLLALGINVNEHDSLGRTALHLLAVKKPKSDIPSPLLDMLITKGADVDARDDAKRTPLHWASWLGQLYAVDNLLRHGASVNARDGQNRTPLHYATCQRDLRIDDRLVQNGGDLRSEDRLGRTPQDWLSGRVKPR